MIFRQVILTAVLVMAAAQTLPRPSGQYPIGRVALNWQDKSRPEVITDAPDDYRELLVYIWYPAAKATAAPGPYWPGIERVAGAAAAQLTNMVGPAWPAIAGGTLRSHATDNAKVGASGQLPILLFSPGGGSSSIAYTAQMEELASHGYVVVGVEHTFDAPVVLFPDGRVIPSAGAYWARLRMNSADDEAYEKKLSEMFAADLVFAVGKLEELSRDRSSMFYGRLDTSRLGVFGHSRGGRNVARACQLDARIKACLSEDGSMAWQPFWLDSNGRSMNQPFMMLDHLDLDLPDEVYAQIGTTREAYIANRSARQREADARIYGTIRGGSYHVTITTPGISHNSFSDFRLLGRPDSPQINSWPKDVQSQTPNAAILQTISAYTLAFFDKVVRGRSSPLLDRSNANKEVRIQTFPAAR